MKTRSVLVYCPGYPFDPKALMPSRALATAAGCLLDAGHATHIRDYGTVECVERLLAGELSDSAKRVSEALLDSATQLNPLQTLHTLWQVRSADRVFRSRMNALCVEIAGELGRAKGLHFVGFMVNAFEDIGCAAMIAQLVRAARPKMRLIAFGTMAGLYAEEFLHAIPVFDCVCIGDLEMSLVALAEKVDAPGNWRTIPNLVFRENSSTHFTERRDGESLGSYPAPAYEPDTYPALRAEQKLKLFELEDCRGDGNFGSARPCPVPYSPVRMKPVASVCKEMWRIATLYGARTFNLCGPDAPASHVTALAHELIRRGLNVTYSRASNVRGAVPAMFQALRQSGCVTVSFNIDTGSQRLLDDYYERGITVTAIETVLRAAKESDLYTIGRFIYPCPQDDYHTRAETIRLIERTRPHAIPVELPQVLPYSRWYREAKAYGYRLSREGLLSRARRCGRKFPLPEGLWRVLPHQMVGLSASQVIAAQQALIFEIESRGIVASVPEDLVRIARLAGYGRRERDFSARVQRDFLTGDTAGIAGLVDQFNEVACVPAKGVALRPFDAMRVAVGN